MNDHCFLWSPKGGHELTSWLRIQVKAHWKRRSQLQVRTFWTVFTSVRLDVNGNRASDNRFEQYWYISLERLGKTISSGTERKREVSLNIADLIWCSTGE